MNVVYSNRFESAPGWRSAVRAERDQRHGERPPHRRQEPHAAQTGRERHAERQQRRVEPASRIRVRDRCESQAHESAPSPRPPILTLAPLYQQEQQHEQQRLQGDLPGEAAHLVQPGGRTGQ